MNKNKNKNKDKNKNKNINKNLFLFHSWTDLTVIADCVKVVCISCSDIESSDIF